LVFIIGINGETMQFTDKEFACWMRESYIFADENSPDPSTKVGAILFLSDGITKLFGTNHLLTGYPKTPADLTNRARKYKLIEHAERDVIYQAARVGFSTAGAIMFCPWAACTDCARAIGLSGIIKVIAHKDALDKTPDRWVEDLKIAKELFESMKVEYIQWSGKVGGCKNLFNGVYWSP
jgi:dCMP deaminase